ncbi:MAG: hypothetical protein K1Y36_20685 [Blastocatellia bacterium]|nr:hypothetical protein [Blastocatellia bacterium]
MFQSKFVLLFSNRLFVSITLCFLLCLGVFSFSSRFLPLQQAAGTVRVAAQTPTATIQFARASYAVREGESNAGVTLSVVRLGSTVGAVSVAYTTADGSAIGGNDFSPVVGTLDFAPGESVKSIVVPVFNDAVNESTENFGVVLNQPLGANLGTPSTAIVSIANSTAQPTVGQIQFSTQTISASEAVGSVTVGVARVNGASGTLSVTYSMVDNTAISPGDYTSATGTLSWGSGDTSVKIITIPIVRDLLVEGPEDFGIALSNGIAATVTIADDGGTPQPGKFKFEFSNHRVIEGGGAPTVYLNVLRIDGSNGTVDVAYTTTQGTATDDFIATSGTLTFADGELSKTISVFTLNDKNWEGEEYFTVNLTSATNGGTLISPSVATVTIIDLDPIPTPTIQFSQSSHTIRESESDKVTLAVTRSGNVSSTLSVNYATANGTAVAPDDYTATSGTLTFLPGESTKTISVFILTDAPVEADETFSVVLSNPVNATLGTASTATVTIRDASAPTATGTPQFSLSPYFANEGDGGVQITVTRTGGAAGPLNLSYATSDGTATAGADYTAASGTIAFGNGDTFPKTFTVRVTPDTLNEGHETFHISLSNAANGAALAGTTVYIVDNATTSQAGFLQFEQGEYPVTETAGGTTRRVNVVRVGGSAGTVTVNYATVNDTALAGSDYTAQSGTLTFAAGVTVQSIDIPILDDTTYEDPERFFVRLNTPGGGAQLGNVETSIVITDNEPEPPGEFYLDYNGTAIPVTEGQPNAKVTVKRRNGRAGTVAVTYSTTDVTATSGADYTGTAGTVLNFLNGEASKDILIPITDDTAPESFETFRVNLLSVSAGVLGAPSQAIVQINDNDSVAPVISSIDYDTGLRGTVSTIIITGSNLGTTPNVQVSGVGVSATVTNSTSTQIQATIEVTPAATLGDQILTVTSGGLASNSLTFKINDLDLNQISALVPDALVTCPKNKVRTIEAGESTCFPFVFDLAVFDAFGTRYCYGADLVTPSYQSMPTILAVPTFSSNAVNSCVKSQLTLQTFPETTPGTYVIRISGISNRFIDYFTRQPIRYNPLDYTLIVTAPPPTIDLGVFKVSHNVKGAELPNSEQNTVGAFVPVNNDDDDYDSENKPDKDQTGEIVGENDLLPIILHKIQPTSRGGNYTLNIPNGIRVWNAANRTGEITATTPIPATSNKELYIEGTAQGIVTLSVNWKEGSTTINNADSIKITVFAWLGPLNVPGYAIYRYTAQGALATSKWIAPSQGSINQGDGSSDVQVLWGEGGVVGKAVYQANSNFIWDLEVNVVKIQLAITSPITYHRPPIQVRQGFMGPWTPELRSRQLTDAAVEGKITVESITGPVVSNQVRGVKFMEIGFVQDAAIRQQHGDFNSVFSNPPVRKRQKSQFDGNEVQFVDSNVMDPLGLPPSRIPWYNSNDERYFFAPGVDPPVLTPIPPKTLTFQDTPAAKASQDMAIMVDGQSIRVSKFVLVFSFNSYFAVHTTQSQNEADQVFTNRAFTSPTGQAAPRNGGWYYDATGNVDISGQWTPLSDEIGTAGSNFTEVKTGARVPITTGTAAQVFFQTAVWEIVNQ